jgi:DNA-directed RNA polymerase subunit RPC12/RpoP
MDEEGTIQKTRRTNAFWIAELHVECPYCGKGIDLLKTEEWKDDWFYKFGALESKEKVDAEVECPYCKLLFVVENTEW